jgi:uncharacterized membrane protein YbhN (UPF0104 family)
VEVKKMSDLKKMARMNCIVLIGLPFYFILLLFLAKIFVSELSWETAAQAFSICSMVVLMSATDMPRKIYRNSFKNKENKKTFFDERDQLINSRAVCTTYFSLCFLILVILIITQSFIGSISVIPVYFVPLIIGGISIFILLVYSVAILVQYGRRGNDGQ